MTLTIGQSLTYLQLCSPDLANGSTIKVRYQNGVERLVEKGKFSTEWTPSEWTRATLVSLPSIEPQAEPSPGDGYRWLIPDVDDVMGDDDRMYGGEWYPVGHYGGKCRENHTYRRRIEPQADPAPRQASEIAREAALALVRSTETAICDHVGIQTVEKAIKELEHKTESMSKKLLRYREAYEYARSIGAIE